MFIILWPFNRLHFSPFSRLKLTTKSCCPFLSGSKCPGEICHMAMLMTWALIRAIPALISNCCEQNLTALDWWLAVSWWFPAIAVAELPDFFLPKELPRYQLHILHRMGSKEIKVNLSAWQESLTTPSEVCARQRIVPTGAADVTQRRESRALKEKKQLSQSAALWAPWINTHIRCHILSDQPQNIYCIYIRTSIGFFSPTNIKHIFLLLNYL